jgi:hypothetical protein
VEDAEILAGYDIHQNPTGPDAQIGSVKVGGDWITSDLLAGCERRTNSFQIISDPNHNPKITSSIASITIGGQVLGATSGSTHILGDYFGFSAEQINALSVGGTKIKLKAGPDNDSFNIGATNDFVLEEV